MKLAMIGLGKMGANMARRLRNGGHEVVIFDRSQSAVDQLNHEGGFIPVDTLEHAVNALERPRILWLMLPSGEPTEKTIEVLSSLLTKGDILIEGGNSNFNDSIRRAAMLKEKGIEMIDAGTSGGIWGLKEGYSLMLGGEESVIDSIRPIFESLAPSADSGWGRVGPSGAGHYVKMVHNGIEYGLMEAYAEGFELMNAREDMDLDLYQISQIWRKGSVVRSWLLDLIGEAIRENPDLSGVQPWVSDSGEGRWTIKEAIDRDVPVPVIADALFRRFESRESDSYALKVLSAMRNQFGGHAMKSKGG